MLDSEQVRNSLSSAVVLTAIVLLAASLRIFELGDLPAGFFCDEAGLGYNAFSLLRTGRDETGTSWPLYVWSFDVSYKNPVFIYSSMLPIATFGLTEFAVRLTSAAYGTATVLAMYFVGTALAGRRLGLLAALLLAVCPWHMHFSRIAFELITFPFFFVSGFAFLVAWMHGRRTLVSAAICFGVALYTYAVAKLFVPLFLLAFTALYARQLFQKRRQETLVALLVGLITLIPLIRFDIDEDSRASQYFLENTMLRASGPILPQLYDLLWNYGVFFGPKFLFTDGDPLLRHAVSGHGELYPLFAPFLVLGTAWILGRKDRRLWLVAFWVALYPIAPALMNEIPSASRGIIGAPGLCLLAALGAEALWNVVTARRGRLLAPIGVALLGLISLGMQVANYWKLYTQEYPVYSAKSFTGFQFGHREIVDYFVAHRDDYDVMVLSMTLNNQPHIFLAFHSAFSPAAYQEGGLGALERLGKMTIGSPDELYFFDSPRRVLMAVRTTELASFTGYVRKQEIIAPDGSIVFVLIEPTALKPFVRSWWVLGPIPEPEALLPPEFDADHPPKTDEQGRRWIYYSSRRGSVGVDDAIRWRGDIACAWAVNFITVEHEQLVRVFAGFDGSGEVWINNQPVPLRQGGKYQEVVADNQVALTSLSAGRNRIAIRTCPSLLGWRFFFRLSTVDGGPFNESAWEY